MGLLDSYKAQITIPTKLDRAIGPLDSSRDQAISQYNSWTK